MQKIKSIALILGVAVMSFTDVHLAIAWSDAPADPPTCPAGSVGCKTPINVGALDQTKLGGLSVMDSVGIGTDDVGTKKLKVQGDTEITGVLTIGGNSNICQLVSYTSTSGTTSCPDGYYTWTGMATSDGSILCCKVSNPI